jgi:hypothetical protein
MPVRIANKPYLFEPEPLDSLASSMMHKVALSLTQVLPPAKYLLSAPKDISQLHLRVSGRHIYPRLINEPLFADVFFQHIRGLGINHFRRQETKSRLDFCPDRRGNLLPLLVV